MLMTIAFSYCYQAARSFLNRTIFSKHGRCAALLCVAWLWTAPTFADVVPAALWRLDEGTGTSTADASGNGNTGTLTGSPAWSAGHTGNALNFNNATSYVSVAPSTSLNNLYSGGVTVMAWIKPASTGGGGSGRIMIKGTTGTSGFGFKMVSGPKVQFGWGYSTSSMTRTSAATITLNTWVHVAATWDGVSGANAHVYVNGVLSDGTLVNGVGTIGDDSTNPINIGNQPDLTRRFDGPIDDARVYNRALTASEIQAIANDNAAPSAPSNLSATAASNSQINLTWTASTDDVGVAGYRVERCQGASCSNFVQVATPTTTSYTDTGLSASTSYSYRIRALDTAYNFSTYSSTGTASTQATANGPVAFWTLSEGSGTSTVDVSGNGNTGTLSGSPSWTTGPSGNALNFNNLNSLVDIAPSSSLNNLHSGTTLMAWIKPASAGEGNGGRIMVKSPGFGFKMISGNKVQFLAGYTPTPVSLTSSAALTLNTWTHVAVTWDGAMSGGTNMYINGVLSNGTFVAGSGSFVDDSAAHVAIGNEVDGTRGFNGPIDEVRMYNRALTASEIQAIANDTAAPSAPSNLSATAASNSQINLTWTASTDDVGIAGYRVERCQGASCSNFVQVATPTTASYNDTGLSAATSYSYRVRAIDTANYYSSYSSTASATTQSGGADTTPPSTPSSPSATAASDTQINLTWTASTDNVGVTNYLIERCQGAGCSNFSQVATSTTTSYSNTGLAASTSYSYRIRATDAANNLSGYSSTVSATTQAPADTQAPTAPSSLSATTLSNSQINLSWGASTDNVGVTGYLVERCQGSGCTNFSQIAAPTGTTYSDTGRSASTSYSYRVRAKDAANNLSGYSNVASATTAATGVECD